MVAILSMLLGTPLCAQARSGYIGPSAVADTAKHRYAIEFVILTVGRASELPGLIPDTVDLPGAPGSGRIQRVIAKHMRTILPPDSMFSIMVHATEQVYSEGELRQLIAFFSSPLGKRYISGQREAVGVIRSVMDVVTQEHQAELQRALVTEIRAKIDSQMSPRP